ncbi:hypothetical protein DC522_19105 [Microvirga sp. KLBC 81]|nr:hypothetical protein DC522_19105 [Microvirga sp. KLBC 81]
MTEMTTRPLGANGGGLPLADDLLRGARPIARFIYGESKDERENEANERRVYHAAQKHGLPVFKLGGVLCARKSTILRWIEAQERSGAAA